jgi:hypothetical protein
MAEIYRGGDTGGGVDPRPGQGSAGQAGEHSVRADSVRESLPQIQGRRPGPDDGEVSYLGKKPVAGASQAKGLEVAARIQSREDAVYFGLTNPFIEDKMVVRIHSRFRSDGKSGSSPYPGVDHVAALPTDLLVVDDGFEALVLHYGQMWRMQLYLRDSGYRAFTANVGVPVDIVNSIESAVQAK